MEIFFRLIQAMSVFLVVAYIYSKSPLFKSLAMDSISMRDRLYLYLVFSSLSILGTYLGTPVQDAIANTRPIGPVLAGIIGGQNASLRLFPTPSSRPLALFLDRSIGSFDRLGRYSAG